MAAIDNLIRQIVRSELDYLEIDRRAAPLRALATRTAAEQTLLDDYEKKLAHDRAVIDAWRFQLNAAGKIPVAQAFRLQILDEVVSEQSAAISEIEQRRKEVQAEIDAKQTGYTAEHGYADASLLTASMNMNIDLNERVDERQNRINLLTDLKGLQQTVWGF